MNKAREIIDLQNDIIGKKIIVFGGNQSGIRCIENLKKLGFEIALCVDNSEKLSGKILTENITIESFGKLKDLIKGNEENYVIIIASSHYTEISEQLDREFAGKCVYYYSNVIEDMYANQIIKSLPEQYSTKPMQAIKLWTENLLSEIRFWANDVAKSEGKYHQDYIEERSINKQFACSHLITPVRNGDIVMDVGCGICSQYGNLLDEGKINLVAVDPLANQYNEINKRVLNEECLENKKVEFGLFEYLDTFYSENYANVIIIDNALDHCFDPLKSIMACLYVLKVSGTLSMKHTIREAVNENYKGLHQWNLDSNENGDFIIWNKEGYVNVTKVLSEVAEITVQKDKRYVCTSQSNISGSIYVTITKKKDIVINKEANNQYLGYTLMEIMRLLSDVNYCNSYAELIKTIC